MFKFKLIVSLLFTFTFHHGYTQDLVKIHQLALENNPELKSAFFNQFSTAELRTQSIAQMLPNISLSGSSSRDRVNNKKNTFQANGTQNFWDHSFTINFRQPVFHLEHWIELDQSDNQIAQSKALYQATSLQLIVKVTEAYFNILAAQDNLAFTVAEKKAIERQLEQATQRFKVGFIAITDVYEAQAGYDQSSADEIEAFNLLDDRKEDLREIIGENNSTLNLLRQDIPLNYPEPADLTSWSTIAESNNFNIIAQINQTEVFRKEMVNSSYKCNTSGFKKNLVRCSEI